jgi:hypothetical protein
MSHSPQHAIARAVRSLSTGAKLGIGALATGGLLAGGAVMAVGAGASTNACVTGSLAGSCGTQGDAQASPLYLTAGGTIASIKAGSPIVGSGPDNVRQQLDFYWFHPAGASNPQVKAAEYAPKGHKSGLCMAGHDAGNVNLRPCADFGTQFWLFSQTNGNFGTWTDQSGTGKTLTAHASGAAVTVVPGPVAPNKSQQFQFVTTNP